MFISIIITARYWRARGSCVVAVMLRATSLKNTRASVSKVESIIIIRRLYVRTRMCSYSCMNFELVRVHERLRLTDKKMALSQLWPW